ncbi:hypothetical protein [Nocardia arthritidis]|uniref:Uncharacterized protein n=1 Tax=Nocardia arthritidis TaxID=228602 RepID=A0A6G9YLF3_9NOCA|nr:hypothetical protein [Nocardia arthritidis]QIS14099.1 hypothetical protein F5544_31285 [Nocardia arthritidis]
MTPNDVPTLGARRVTPMVSATATEIRQRLGFRRNRLTETELSAVAMAMAEAIHATNTQHSAKSPGR